MLRLTWRPINPKLRITSLTLTRNPKLRITSLTLTRNINGIDKFVMLPVHLEELVQWFCFKFDLEPFHFGFSTSSRKKCWTIIFFPKKHESKTLKTIKDQELQYIQWNAVIKNRFFGQIDYFSEQINPVIMNPGSIDQKWPVRSCSYKRVRLHFEGTDELEVRKLVNIKTQLVLNLKCSQTTQDGLN